MSVSIPFIKMVGTGNDFVLVDTARHKLSALKTRWPQVARAICDRRYGVGADGLLVLEPSKTADAKMRIFNPDGSEAEMCGNGARCAALYASAHMNGRQKQTVVLQTKAGLVSAQVHGTTVAMWMTEPKIIEPQRTVRVNGTDYQVCVLDTGVPHAVLVVNDLKGQDVERLGQSVRQHEAFQPHGTNVDFIAVIGKTSLAMRTYERGVEAETPACGTGAVASAIAGVILGLVNGSARKQLPSVPMSQGTRQLLERRFREVQNRISESHEKVERRIEESNTEQPVKLEALREFKKLRRMAHDRVLQIQQHEIEQVQSSLAAGTARQCAAVNVHTQSGEVLRVSFELVLDGKTKSPEKMAEARERVSNVILEGAAKTVFEGSFPLR
ncbi:MAG: diaminopimelate epimerase [Candidatus Omnitrophica bacterium]|nr:diaminopimelate epimerase [Candidatus Omnitrophota bacterium]